MLAVSHYCGASDDRSRAEGSNPVKPLSKLPGPNSERPSSEVRRKLCWRCVSSHLSHEVLVSAPEDREGASLMSRQVGVGIGGGGWVDLCKTLFEKIDMTSYLTMCTYYH